jgi:hypothetical protein
MIVSTFQSNYWMKSLILERGHLHVIRDIHKQLQCNAFFSLLALQPIVGEYFTAL